MSQYDPQITLVAKSPLAVTADQRAQAVWLVRKYTSLTFIGRMAGIYANFVGGYEDFARASATRVAFHRENLARLYEYRALQTDGLDLVRRGFPVGYASILQGCAFEEYLTGRRFEYGLENEEIGFHLHGPPTGLYAWAAVAIRLANQVATTLRAAWAFPGVLGPKVILPAPAAIPPEPAPLGPTVDTGQSVPRSGIWRPAALSFGCPNYLWAGREAPPAQRAHERYDYPPFPGERGLEPAHTEYTYVPEAVRWELLWEEDRHQDGRPPASGEESFLDRDAEPPPWPPVAQPAT